MARSSSRTSSLEIESPTTGEKRVIIERSYVKASKIGNRYLMASKQFALFDAKGQRYERISSVAVTCVSSGERFQILGNADSIRKSA